MRYLAALFIAALTTTAAPAYSMSTLRWYGNVRIDIVNDHGSVLQTIPYREFRTGETQIIKKYLEANKGERYSMIVRNFGPARIGLVIAVDGRNIISGRRSELGNREEMYIVNGYETGRYDGWRTDRDTVHRFYFTDMDDSYSMRTFQDASAMGIIAVAVYREKERPQPPEERQTLRNAPAPESSGRAKSSVQSDESAGTGFGDASYSPVVTVAFEPEGFPIEKMLVKYAWHDVLCRQGILRCQPEPGNRLWDEGAYAPFPPAYRTN